MADIQKVERVNKVMLNTSHKKKNLKTTFEKSSGGFNLLLYHNLNLSPDMVSAHMIFNSHLPDYYFSQIAVMLYGQFEFQRRQFLKPIYTTGCPKKSIPV